MITGMFFNRLNGQVDYTIQDPARGDPVGRLGQLACSTRPTTS